jgi:DNA-binding LacI/PurR family transcriptional regulator
MMPTIGDVARRAGVAPSTVSNALSGHRAVKAATRERILAAVAELGYRPNAAASNLRLGRTRTVGLAIPLATHGHTLSLGSFSQYVESIADRLNDHDYKLLCLVSRTPEAKEVVGLVQSGHVDGLILLQIRLQDPRLVDLQASNAPFVAIGRPAEARGLVWVDADLRQAADLAVQHLLERGHQRIAILGGNPIFGYQYQALAGFRQALRQRGLPLHRDQVLRADPPIDWHATLAPFQKSSGGPTALITTSDLEAVTALRVFTEMGVQVPNEVGIVNLGDSVLTQLAQPAITAVCWSVEDTCRHAVARLLEMIAGTTPQPKQLLMPVHMVPRASTHPPDWGVPCTSSA